MKNYFIKASYQHRETYSYFNDTVNEDNWQKEVYITARKLFDVRRFSSVVDYGCGSSFKLIKHFGNTDFIGIDVKETVEKLKDKYPSYEWSTDVSKCKNYDLLICSDVIEHFPDPDILIENIKVCNPKLIVISTPDRDLLSKNQDGPPENPCHMREWAFQEFAEYIGYHFEIIDHYISNIEQATQLIVARIKT